MSSTITKSKSGLLRRVGSGAVDSVQGNAGVVGFFGKEMAGAAVRSTSGPIKIVKNIAVVYGAFVASYKVVPYLDKYIVPNVALSDSNPITAFFTSPIVKNTANLMLSHGRNMHTLHAHLQAVGDGERATYLIIGEFAGVAATLLTIWAIKKMHNVYKYAKGKLST